MLSDAALVLLQPGLPSAPGPGPSPSPGAVFAWAVCGALDTRGILGSPSLGLQSDQDSVSDESVALMVLT